MILEMTASVILATGAVPTQGTSGTARFVAAEAEKGRRRLQDSYAFGMGGKGAFGELFETFGECRVPNWDGYGAQPISNETYSLAFEFLEALPLGTPAPSVGAEPDGHLTLEWYRSPQRVLSVSISPDGDLHYAALLGLAKTYGTEPFLGEVPAIISDLINRVMVV